MGNLSDIVHIIKDVSLIAGDLVKCQAEHVSRLYKEILTNLLTWVLVVLVAILLAIGGLAMIMLAVHRQLSMLIGPAGSAYILGAFLILTAVIIFLLGRTMLRD